MASIAVLTLTLLLLPRIPGLNRLPRLLGVYRLIWRDYYRERTAHVTAPSPPEGVGLRRGAGSHHPRRPGGALMNADERRTAAYHESGHALIAYLLPNMDAIRRVTIIPRGRSLGAMHFLPIDDRRNYRRDYLRNRMLVGLGGRAAEEVACEEITAGAQNDLGAVTRIARAMVTQLGMDEELGLEVFEGAEDGDLDGTA